MKILSAETNLGSATNVSNAPVVRLFNSGDSNILVTRKDYNAVVVGSFMVPAGEVVYTEKYFTDTLEGSADVKATKTAYSSMMSFEGSGSSGPSYTYSVSASSVDEGGNWTTTVTTTNVADNTTLYWSLSGTNITSADFSSGALTGSGTISNNTFNFSHTIAEDTLTEGTETVTIKLFTDSGRNTQVGNTVTVTLNDTSLSPTYTTSLSHTSRDEGDSFTTTMTTTNVANSTELWWELSGTGIAAGDFSSGALTGSGTISSNTFNFSHTIASDNTTEGEETLSIKFYSDSGRTSQVGSTLTCTINDTSVTPAGNSVFFDGADDVLNLPSSTDWSFGTGDFTIEAFCWRTENIGFFLWDHTTAPGNFTVFSYANGDIRVYNNQFLVSNVNPGNETWFHLAVVRQSGTLMFFIDGTKSSTTHSFTYNIGGNGTAGVNIGKSHWNEMLGGYVSNLRVLKGQALYTSNFTPPTSALTNINNTVFLGCQSSTDVTAATVTPGTITKTSNPTAQTFGPFSSSGGGGDNYGVDFTGTLDEKRITASHASLAPGTNEFTIECWFKTTSVASGVSPTSYHLVMGSRETNNDNGGEGIVIGVNTNGRIVVFSSGFHINPTDSSWDVANYLNQWVHVAVTRDNNDLLTLWLDGVNKGTSSNFTNNLTRSAWSFGNLVNDDSEDFNGSVSNARITINQSLYSSNFTPATSQLTMTSQGANAGNVKFLGLNGSSITADTVGTATVTSDNSPNATAGPF